MQPRLGVNYYEQSGNVDDSFRSVSLVVLHHYYFINQESEKNVLWVILFIIGAAPLLYLAIDHVKNDYMDANIGLGLAFMFTWIYSAVAFIIGFILLVKKKRNNNISKEL